MQHIQLSPSSWTAAPCHGHPSWSVRNHQQQGHTALCSNKCTSIMIKAPPCAPMGATLFNDQAPKQANSRVGYPLQHLLCSTPDNLPPMHWPCHGMHGRQARDQDISAMRPNMHAATELRIHVGCTKSASPNFICTRPPSTTTMAQ